ncbi:MAG: PP2C family protein-serine/threonine phosphatase [Planctomycetaceae bacterium]
MPTKLELFGVTDIGRKRSSNEDQFMVADLCRSFRVHHTSLALDHRTQLFGATQGQLLLVADGMGGHEAGERASQLALDGVVDHFLNRIAFRMIDGDAGDAEFEEQLKAALTHCQQLIRQDVSAVPQRKGMGSTLTMAYIVWPKLYLVHVGDSRCYLIRDGQIQQLTRDHTMASSLNPEPPERDESLPDEDGPLTNVLWNVLGGDGDLRPDALAIELQINDAIVLCTDGLTRYVSRKRLREVIAGTEPLNDACSHLVAEANQAGGSDNITIVACRLREQEVDQTVAELSIEQSAPTNSEAAPDPRLADTEDLLPAAVTAKF